MASYQFSLGFLSLAAVLKDGSSADKLDTQMVVNALTSEETKHIKYASKMRSFQNDIRKFHQDMHALVSACGEGPVKSAEQWHGILSTMQNNTRIMEARMAAEGPNIHAYEEAVQDFREIIQPVFYDMYAAVADIMECGDDVKQHINRVLATAGENNDVRYERQSKLFRLGMKDFMRDLCMRLVGKMQWNHLMNTDAELADAVQDCIFSINEATDFAGIKVALSSFWVEAHFMGQYADELILKSYVFMMASIRNRNDRLSSIN